MRIKLTNKQRLNFYRIMHHSTNNQHNAIVAAKILNFLYDAELKKSNLRLMFRDKKLKQFYKTANHDLSSGLSFGDLLKKYVPSTEALIIYANEKNGKLSQGFYIAKSLLAQQMLYIDTFKKAMIGPIINLCFAFSLLGFIFSNVLPPIVDLIPSDKLSSFQNLILYLVHNYLQWYLISVGLLSILILFTVIALPYYKSGFRLILEYLPPFSIYKIVQGSAFMYTLDAMIKSGIKQSEALQHITNLANPYVSYRAQQFLYFMSLGKNLGEAMILSNLQFPTTEMIEEIAITTEYGDPATIISELIQNLNEDGIILVSRQANIAKNISFSIVMIIILFTVIAMFSFISSFQNSYGSF